MLLSKLMLRKQTPLLSSPSLSLRQSLAAGEVSVDDLEEGECQGNVVTRVWKGTSVPRKLKLSSINSTGRLVSMSCQGPQILDHIRVPEGAQKLDSLLRTFSFLVYQSWMAAEMKWSHWALQLHTYIQ